MIPHRPMFWHIEYVWLFYVLAAVAGGLFLAGVAAHVWVWKRAARSFRIPFSQEAVKKTLVDTLLGRRVFQGDMAAGAMHFLLFWGFLSLFIGTLLLAAHHYVHPFLIGSLYLGFSMAMEIGGAMLMLGLLWAIFRRYIQRIPRLETTKEDALVVAWLVLVVLSGFVVEGLRMAFQHPQWGGWSFVGNCIGNLLTISASESLYPYLWWVHTLLALGLIAVIPFTKLFHLIGAPASLYVQNTPKTPLAPEDETVETLDLADLVFFDACMRCGRCVEVCPSAGAGEPFAPRDFVQAMRLRLWMEYSPFGDVRFLSRGHEKKMAERIWYCTTCRACLEVCPIYGATFEAIRKMRAVAIEEGTQVPQILIQTLDKLYRYNNPWEASKKKRAAWAKELDLVDLTKTEKETELCYFVGCTTSFDTRAQEIARSFSWILQKAGINFGILGKKEPCCGDIARRVGEIGLFHEQVDACLKLFSNYGIEHVVTSSPHCFHTFQNEYPEAPFKARHYTQVLHDLIVQRKMEFEKKLEVTVTYHDPCYLGRYNRIFDEPREVIRAIPGIRLVEMAHHGPDSLCCGGGGGRMWQEDLDGETKMSEIRIKEAHATGAQILITACPLCLIMLEDARKTSGLEEELRVMDLNELVAEAMGKGNNI